MTRVCVAFELPDVTTQQVDDIEAGISVMQSARATCLVYVSEKWANAVGPLQVAVAQNE